MTPEQVLKGLGIWLGPTENAQEAMPSSAFPVSIANPWAPTIVVITPFATAAHLYSRRHATYDTVSAADLRSLKANTTVDIYLTAYSSTIHGDDDMTVVIKQADKVLHATTQGQTDVEPTTKVDGYKVTKMFSFPITALDVAEPFIIAAANVVLYGSRTGESDWNTDPTTFR